VQARGALWMVRLIGVWKLPPLHLRRKARIDRPRTGTTPVREVTFLLLPDLPLERGCTGSLASSANS
jgi:hypothetical protein